MRRWIALIGGLAVVAVTGTALALAGPGWTSPEQEAKAEPTKVEVPDTVKTTGTTVKKTTTSEATEEKPTEVKAPEKKDLAAPKEAADTTPPDLTIVHPVDGQVFKQKEVVFEGSTEPGARVFAGKYEAEVRDDGTWRIVLYLAPGGNRATIKAKDTAGNVASRSVTVTYQVPENSSDDKKPKDKEDQATWGFTAGQVYGECAESPPYDVFHGTAKPGSTVYVKSEFGNGTTTVNEKGKWEIKVFFESAPGGKTFPVKVKDEFGNHKVFEFTYTG